MLAHHVIAAWLAIILDKTIGDPRWLPHPVRGFGFVIAKLDSLLNKNEYRRIKGVIAVSIVVVIAFLPAYYLVLFVYQFNELAGLIVETLLIFTTIAEKSLAQAGREVESPLQAGNLALAREKVSWIVGRDTDQLEESEVVRATVETIAENTSDGVTAPLFYAFIGGAPFALLYRAVNTCDSMLGYKNEKYLKFGWSSARLDDLLNLIPSRITGLLMVVSNFIYSKQSMKDCLRILFRDAKRHPSPNSGWCEAAVASLLQVQLGGRNTYKGQISERAKMGEPIDKLQVLHIDLSIMIMKRTVLVFMILLTIGVVWFDMAFTRS